MFKYFDRLFWLIVGFFCGAVTGIAGIAIVALLDKPPERSRAYMPTKQ